MIGVFSDQYLVEITRTSDGRYRGRVMSNSEPRTEREYRVDYHLDDGRGKTCEPTRDPAWAGLEYRGARKDVATVGGHVELQERTVTYGPWKTVEREECHPGKGD